MVMTPATPRERPGRTRLTRDDWAAAALAAMADGGLAAVAVEPLAARLGATKGSFYWHFANREALLEAALAAWEQATTTAVLARVESSSTDPRDQLRLLIELVVDIAERDPVGIALQAHASHPVVGPALERVTRARIDGTVRLFARMGFPPVEARRRALLAYSCYLGHAQLAHSTPAVLPRSRPSRHASLDHVLDTLAAPPRVKTR
jgi:AcrR family transcriptional regulator